MGGAVRSPIAPLDGGRELLLLPQEHLQGDPGVGRVCKVPCFGTFLLTYIYTEINVLTKHSNYFLLSTKILLSRNSWN